MTKANKQTTFGQNIVGSQVRHKAEDTKKGYVPAAGLTAVLDLFFVWLEM